MAHSEASFSEYNISSLSPGMGAALVLVSKRQGHLSFVNVFGRIRGSSQLSQRIGLSCVVKYKVTIITEKADKFCILLTVEIIDKHWLFYRYFLYVGRLFRIVICCSIYNLS